MEPYDVRHPNWFACTQRGIECAQCGAPLYVPEWSEHFARGRVRHLWQCETCGTAFETTQRLTEEDPTWEAA